MNSKNTAFLVIDVVNTCADRKCESPEYGITFNKIRLMIPKLNAFIKQFRDMTNSPVIFVNLTKWQKKYLTENLNELYTDPDVCYYSDDESEFSEEFFLVKPEKKDLVITKNHPDAFTNIELSRYLKDKGIKYLVIAGIFTDGCVLATIVNGFSKGYNFVILKDLVETTDVPTRQRLQKLLIDYTFPFMYGKTITSEEFLTSWAK